jgi:hypothetical protein
MTTTVPWRLQADYMETCNCDFGCPCNFNGLPTGGRCETLVGYHLRSGLYGDVLLDGVDLVYAASWPRAIHEGSGTLCVYVSEKASPEQRRAISEIVYGRAGGSGPFVVFAATFRYVLDPQFVPIEMTVEGKKSHFSVPGLLEASLTPHTDPVSGNEQEVEINLPKGFIWKTAQAAKTAVMRILSPNLNFDHAGRNAFYSVVEYQGP